MDIMSTNPEDNTDTPSVKNKRKLIQRSPQSANMDENENASKAARSEDTGHTVDPHHPDAYSLSGLDEQHVKLAEMLEKRLGKVIKDTVDTQLRQVMDDKCVAMENSIERRVISNVDKRLARVERHSAIALSHASKMQKEMKYVKSVNTKQLDRLIKCEMEINKNHIIFKGVPENKLERSNDYTLKIVKKIIGDIPSEQKRLTGVYKYNFAGIVIERCHRMGRFNRESKFPRDIFVKVINFMDKQALMDGYNKRYLPTGVFLRNDYPPEIRSANRALGPILEAAKGTVYGTTRIKLIQGVIVIDNVQRITLKNVLEIPKPIEYMKQFFVETDALYAWFGILHIFSNFHWCPFEVKKETFFMPEQFITVELAVFANDDDAKTELMNMQDPYEMKRRAKQISGYDKEAWGEKMMDAAYIANKAKYEQNPYFLGKLLDTHPKLLAEASSEEPWGCGLTLKHPNIKNPRRWVRQGIMGETLQVLRQEFLEARPSHPSLNVPAPTYAEVTSRMQDLFSSSSEEDSSEFSDAGDIPTDPKEPVAANNESALNMEDEGEKQ